MKKAQNCDKRGYLWLTTKNGVRYVTGTTCKTWGCRACAPKVLALARMKMAFGILEVKDCWLTTLTYRRWEHRVSVGAESVAVDFRALITRLKVDYPNLSWMKIPELTKAGMIHLHCLMGGLRGSDAALTARVSEAWYDITGDSYIVDVRKTYEAEKLGNYLSKYLVKGMRQREEMEALGFMRRYSSSRNWPKPEMLRLRGTVMDRWLGLERSAERLGDYGRKLMESSKGAYLMERVGDDLVELLYGKAMKRAEIRKIERWMYDKNFS